ncbi:MAG: 50S ribosomal protein L11 methyltransferase [Deltaproteobacteria bacterium]|nr:50S ribosomal protein L11 methyltransferase [Deltaproteobacteria bacterium]
MPNKITAKKTREIIRRHHPMLADRFRTPLLIKAIQKTVRPGDVVLDLGCGAGVLSLAAVEAGVKKVYACDIDESIRVAKNEAQKRGIRNIEFRQALSFDLKLPERVDVIVAETVGSLGLDENIVPSVYDARRRFLKEGGKIIPGRVRIFLAPVGTSNSPQPPLKLRGGEGGVMSAPFTTTKIKPSELLANPAIYWKIDFQTIHALGFDRELAFRARRDGALRGFAGWFEAEWAPGIVTNTAPGRPLTHWKQTFLPISKPIRVGKGDPIVFRLRIYPKGGPCSTESAIEWGYQTKG